MKISEKQNDVNILGLNWEQYIEHSSEYKEDEIGCLINVFSNNEYGMFASIYIKIEQFNELNNNQNILNTIKNKYKEGKPCIFYQDSKYKDICSEWNKESNTIYNIKDFIQ